jgi:beta-glucosidase
LLDGTIHRALAAEAAAKCTVLLKNTGGMLPIGSNNKLKKSPQIAVVGPFARCTGGLCYAHDYFGTPSFTNDFALSITQRAAALGYPAVTYAQGSNDTCAKSCDSRANSAGKHWIPCEPDETSGGVAAAAVAEAVAMASKADITVLALGLGNKVEAEGCDRPNMTLP